MSIDTGTSAELEFNLNQTVYIKLTDEGRLFLKQKHDQIWIGPWAAHQYIAPREDSEGWSEWQLWDLMSVFGDQFYWGMTKPNNFALTIRFKESEFKRVDV